MSGSSSLHVADEDSVDGKNILGELLLIRGQLVEENHEFCRMEEEYILEEIEGETTKSVLGLKPQMLEVDTGADITEELVS
ncbi:hypothetical protein BC936DRAFT_142295 [Jimgerdemannia flammicorona]|uniref:Uncharacterized protein n=1 Tax=Jimgerdemannia flammicorona TaxID=994334 RepID=A0A433DFB0_9FUNG|nr:hypothetical protein BC936DRAFT_142295 [Jimgerdemannia flammicorona]